MHCNIWALGYFRSIEFMTMFSVVWCVYEGPVQICNVCVKYKT